MPRSLLLHIGLSKTGSSSIQRVLAQQRQALQALGVYYPTSAGWANHALLPALVCGNKRLLWAFHPIVWEGTTPEARLARFAAEWRAEMDALPPWATRAIVSAEQIGMLMRTDADCLALAAFLRRDFDDIRVLVYLRRQDLHLASAYSQWLRGGVIRPAEVPAGGTDIFPEYDYGEIVRRFGVAFGPDRVIPRIFDRKDLAGGDVVEDFFTVAGFRVEVPPEDPHKNANLSLSLEGQALLHAAGTYLLGRDGNESWRDSPTWRRLAEAVSERYPGRGWQPTRDEAREFIGRFAATNEYVRARYFPDRPSLFSTGFDDLPETPRTLPRDGVVGAALEVLFHEVSVGNLREANGAMARFRLLRQLGDRKGMRSALIRAVKFAPEVLAPHLRLAEMSFADGDIKQAEEHVRAAKAIAPEDEQVVRLDKRVVVALRQAQRAAAGAPAAPPAEAHKPVNAPIRAAQ